MAKPPDLRNLLCGSKSPVPTSKLATSLQPKADPSQATQVFFKPPTPTPASDSNNNMDAANVADPDPTITIPTSTPSLPKTALQSWKELKGMPLWMILMTPRLSLPLEPRTRSFQAATKSTHNLTETLNLWSHHGYCLDADAANLLITELLQAVYTVSEIGLIQHALAAGSEAQTIALCALIKSLHVQALSCSPFTTTPTLWTWALALLLQHHL
jgi:hypothetical protein